MVSELRKEFAPELAKLEGAANVGVELESVYARTTQISGMPLRDSYDFAQTIFDDYGRPYGQGLNAVVGASGRAEAGPLAFYVRGEYQHSAAIADYSPATAQDIANTNHLPLNSVPTFPSVNQFRTIEAYVALNVANWQFSFGNRACRGDPTSAAPSCCRITRKQCLCCVSEESPRFNFLVS